jgi:hypothetical protein
MLESQASTLGGSFLAMGRGNSVVEARHLTRRAGAYNLMKLYFAVAAIIITTALFGSLSAQTNEQAPAGTKVDRRKQA